MPAATATAHLPPELLAAAGERLCGEHWQRSLARVLGPHHPDGPREAIDDRLVRRWAAGERHVPAWVLRVLVRLLERERDRTAQVCEQIRGLL